MSSSHRAPTPDRARHLHVGRPLSERIVAASGGRARAVVIALLGAALGLETADTSTIGAVAPQLEVGLRISHAEVGALLSVSLGLGAIFTLPFGLLADRIHRTRLLSVCIVVWSGALVACGVAGSYLELVLFRLALGAISAAAWPVVASLVGDYFAPRERGRIYGLVMAGELLGTGVGFGISGNVAGALSWRAAFWVLAAPGFLLAWAVWRRLPEPVRGGYSRLAPGRDSFVPAEEAHRRRSALGAGVETREAPPQREGGGFGHDDDPEAASLDRADDAAAASVDREDDLVRAAIEHEHIPPDPALVLRRNPVTLTLWESTRYILRVRTNVWLIVAGAMSYFFYAGIQTFATEFMRARYGLGQSAATSLLVLLGAGSVIGVVVAGRLADRLIRQGHVNGRIVVPAGALALAVVFFLPGVLSSALIVSGPLFFLGAGTLEAANSPLNAARLDIMHSRLWGRAEGVRTALRTGAEAIAPVLFGFIADVLGSGNRGSVLSASTGSAMHGQGLERAFLIMLVPLAVSCVFVLLAGRTYAGDVATAEAFERRTRPGQGTAPASRP